ncbi:MAG: hypothetical protein HY272_11020 [Gammaproteobacteria bacterium]|nr:hypothetical protein [Gammaproteobacteria bacterium]
MKKIVAFASAAALLSMFAMPGMAADKAAEKKTPEEMCKAMAEKDKVSADKMDAYIKTCVEKHTKASAPAKPAGK